MFDILSLAASNLTSPVVLFFVLGFAAALVRSNLALPEPVAKALSIYLMMAIGFKGGAAVADYGVGADLILALVAGAILSAFLPLIAFALLSGMSRLPQVDRAAVAAHYGSISIVTLVAATDSVTRLGQDYEGFIVAVAAVMETPAILVGLWLANRGRSVDTSDQLVSRDQFLREIFLNSSVVILIGAFIIGFITGPAGLKEIEPLIVDPFKGLLCLFLLDMGAIAGRGLLKGGRDLSAPVIGFGLIMPLVGATVALPVAWAIGLSAGGAALFVTLAASASYIAVPAALRMALPEARPAISLTLSLAVTFPFNLTIGIPLYQVMSNWIIG